MECEKYYRFIACHALIILFRPHRLNSIDLAYCDAATDVTRSVFCLCAVSVCLSVFIGHTIVPCKDN